MDRKAVLAVGALMTLCVPLAVHAQEGDPYTLESMEEFNGELKALWMDIQVEQIEVLGVGRGHASSRIHQMPFRWVAGDTRRNADGAKLTYLVDRQDLGGSGLSASSTEAAIDRAMGSWASSPCLYRAPMVKRADTGADPDIFDSMYGFGDFGNFRLASIVHAGWMPREFFEAVNGPGSGDTILAFSVTFVFIGADGQPTDVNRDGYMDTAVNEVYYNEGFSWLIGSGQGADLESVALHEVGHSLGLGHVGPPLEAVMGPLYLGLSRRPTLVDQALLCSVWIRWPR